MSIPLRVSDALFQEAEIEGGLMNRSAAKQVEFWAELGKKVAHLIAPADMLALMQGIAKVRVDLPDAKPVNPGYVFSEVDKASASASGETSEGLIRNVMYYEASQSKPGLLDRVMPDGARQAGHFKNGKFIVA